jgi:hypothetical protein
MGKTRELEIEQQCLMWLNTSGYFAFKLKNVGLYDERSQSFRRLGRFEVRGLPDACAFLPSGRCCWIEFKSATGVQSQYQKLFQNQVEKYQGLYIVVRSVTDLRTQLQKIEGH